MTSDSTSASTVRGIDVDAVSAWLDANIDGAQGPYRYLLLVGGHSNLTYRVTDANGTDYVLRRPPLGAVLATAHDMAREHRIISGVGQTDVPVPRALGLCEDESVNDAPFYVMSHVTGEVLHSDEEVRAHVPDDATKVALSHHVADVLADLHLANPDDIGLGELGRKEDYLGRQLKRWRSQWEKSKTRELADMEDAYELLMAAKPEQRYTGIVHGDYRFGNLLVDPVGGKVTGVLDWELCTLGDVMADVGYLLNNWAHPDEKVDTAAVAFPTTEPGFPTRAEMVERYQERTGFEVSNVDYYRAFQHWRLAAIVEGVMGRYMKGVMGEEGIDIDAYRVRIDTMAAEALRLLRSLA
ncbi:MAG: phosphotransferase family protein [Acidimicrobiales bacterium]